MKPNVHGLGGVFLRAEDPSALKDWYGRHLGLEFQCFQEGQCYGLDLLARDHDAPSLPVSTLFSIQKATSPLPPERHHVMLNWRVRDLEAFLALLAADGIVPDKREDCEYGRFAWITDPEGNRLELYQPAVEPDAQ